MNRKEIEELLPGYNCGSCGYNSCRDYANYILNNNGTEDKCPILNIEKYKTSKVLLNGMLSKTDIKDNYKSVYGVLDNYEADIVLSPLKGECSCREVLLFLIPGEVKVGDVVKYRPIGCPIVHFAKVIEVIGAMITVFVVGPEVRDESTQIKDLDKCMIMGFEGVSKGKNVQVGQTVRFVPKHCMMQKVHSGVIVNINDDAVRIEGIDLKVWAPPVTVNNEQ